MTAPAGTGKVLDEVPEPEEEDVLELDEEPEEEPLDGEEGAVVVSAGEAGAGVCGADAAEALPPQPVDSSNSALISSMAAAHRTFRWTECD